MIVGLQTGSESTARQSAERTFASDLSQQAQAETLGAAGARSDRLATRGLELGLQGCQRGLRELRAAVCAWLGLDALGRANQIVSLRVWLSVLELSFASCV